VRQPGATPFGGCEPQAAGQVVVNLNVGNDRARLLAVLSHLIPFIGSPLLTGLRGRDVVSLGGKTQQALLVVPRARRTTAPGRPADRAGVPGVAGASIGRAQTPRHRRAARDDCRCVVGAPATDR
jgi:hypothetical protein